jgi:hypothetical protein
MHYYGLLSWDAFHTEKVMIRKRKEKRNQGDPGHSAT